MKELLLSFILVFPSCRSILLDGSNPPNFITADEYRKLVDFILEEKQLRHGVEHKVGTLRQQLGINTASHQTLEANYQALLQRHSNINVTHDDLENKGSQLEHENQTIFSLLSNNLADIKDLKQKEDSESAFTAWHPTSAPRSGYITFTSVLTNNGNDFNSSTGIFTCRQPGVYSFYLHFYRYPTTSYGEGHCYIYKNSGTTDTAYSDPYSTYRSGYHESSTSMTMHLRRGDTVSVGSCTSTSTIYSYTSFTGLLIRAD